MRQKIVVTLTTWTGRIDNIPSVLDSILSQTVQPSAIILNLSEEEFPNRSIPEAVDKYIKSYKSIKVNWCEGNTRVYKKILPTLSIYPNALIMSIDDDYIYPPTMIEEFVKVHKKYPDSPISGNHFIYKGLQCHCGNASMIQAKHLEGWEEYANDEYFRENCLSDDLFYTMLAAKNGYLYEHTPFDYMHQLTTFNEGEGYSRTYNVRIQKSWETCYKAMGMAVVCYPNEGKPNCVLGAAQTETGKWIEEKMVRWLSRDYNLYVVEHDGSTFEYAAIKFMRDLMTRKNEPCLYLHTKGAYNRHDCTDRVHRMWKYEFTKRQKEYFDAVNVDKPMVASPYTGTFHTTWFNGWVANEQALREMNFKKDNSRFFYEYQLFKHIDVIGMRMNNIDAENKLQTMHQDLIKNFEKIQDDETMDILYVVGPGSKWNDNELKYSLRSIAMYGLNVGRIYLVGHKPDFVNDLVTYIPCDDPYDCAHKNILHKVVYAIEHSDISNHFLISSDDHFYIRQTDFANLPVYYRDMIPEEIEPQFCSSTYHISMLETRWLLIKSKLTTYATNPHCNTHFDVDVYRKNKKLFDACFKLKHGGEMNCIMGNLLINEGYKHEQYRDCKLGHRTIEPLWQQHVGKTNCVSSIPNIQDTYLSHYLRKEFNTKCKYEK